MTFSIVGSDTPLETQCICNAGRGIGVAYRSVYRSAAAGCLRAGVGSGTSWRPAAAAATWRRPPPRGGSRYGQAGRSPAQQACTVSWTPHYQQREGTLQTKYSKTPSALYSQLVIICTICFNSHSLLKRALTIVIGLLYLQLTDHANVPSAVDIIIFIQGFPETWKLLQGFLQGKKIEKGCFKGLRIQSSVLILLVRFTDSQQTYLNF
jgi:hypothetical protein